jgi:predicted ribosome quality control (RQC) complex YloA/Tae2 family protein
MDSHQEFKTFSEIVLKLMFFDEIGKVSLDLSHPYRYFIYVTPENDPGAKS